MTGTTNDNVKQDVNNEETVTISKQELEELKSLKDEVQTIKESYKNSTQEAQKLQWITKVGTDKKNFVKLYESDKRIAEQVAEYFNETYGGDGTAEDYYNSIKEEKSDFDKMFDEERLTQKIETKFNESLEKKEADNTLKSLLEDKGIKKTSNFGKDLMTEFEDLMEGKKYTSANVKKFFGKAFRETKQVSQFADEYAHISNNLQGLGKPSGIGNKGTQKPRKLLKQQSLRDRLGV